VNLLVSVVTPSFNQAPYLEYTLQSVQAQDYPAVEHLVVDGGSTDGSVEIIRRYAHRLAWWVSEPDQGQAEAINKGMRRASGEIVAWLNSDDLYLPGAISRAVAALQANPELGLVYGDAVTIDLQGRPLNRLTFGDWGMEDLLHFRIICQPAVFMRRQVLEQAGYLDPSYHMMLDHHLWVRMAALAPIQYIGGGARGKFIPLAAARHHPTAKNVSQPARFADETLRLLNWLQTQPRLAEQIAQNSHLTRGGAMRLVARYLLDSGQPAAALHAYLQALLAWPGYTLKHAHRMSYAVLSLFGFGAALDRWRNASDAKVRRSLADQLRHTEFPILYSSGGERGFTRLENWPGLCLEC
jgi:hypothetical protein